MHFFSSHVLCNFGMSLQMFPKASLWTWCSMMRFRGVFFPFLTSCLYKLFQSYERWSRKLNVGKLFRSVAFTDSPPVFGMCTKSIRAQGTLSASQRTNVKTCESNQRRCQNIYFRVGVVSFSLKNDLTNFCVRKLFRAVIPWSAQGGRREEKCWRTNVAISRRSFLARNLKKKT